ncbi:MAG: hypothetical protein JW716_03365 [Candidatus Aenigmarchaeota archaeon]|nr:hypothetical protein [Candidatus Aenigmarchaeota archaeon]
MQEQKVRIIADNREMPSGILSVLKSLGVETEFKQLDSGDYICSDRVCAERKTVVDFLSSITDGRLFEQLKRLKDSFEMPVLLIEGNPECLFSERNVHPNAVRGALSSVIIDYKIPILWTHGLEETAAQLFSIAKREQIQENRTPSIRISKKVRSTKELQEYFVSGLPDINSVLSRNLLEKFGSPLKLLNADLSEIMKVEGIGKERAKKIYEVLNIDYY